MARAGEKLRPVVKHRLVSDGIHAIANKLQYRLSTKGRGAYASRHEILGILEEEFLEAKEAVRDNSAGGFSHYQEELLDIAVGALFGYISMNVGHIKPKEKSVGKRRLKKR